MKIAEEWASLIPGTLAARRGDQSSGRTFESEVSDFLNKAFDLFRSAGIDAAVGIKAARIGDPRVAKADRIRDILEFDQFAHLKRIEDALDADPSLEVVFGRQYGVRPDVVVYRSRRDPANLGGRPPGSQVSIFSPFFSDAKFTEPQVPILEAIVSSKFSLRSDRAQNVRTESGTAIGTRKGKLPRLVAVSAEPMCSGGRLESLALGTGAVDCIYHSGLPELRLATVAAGAGEETIRLDRLIEGRRIRDISDLPFDLIV